MHSEDAANADSDSRVCAAVKVLPSAADATGPAGPRAPHFFLVPFFFYVKSAQSLSQCPSREKIDFQVSSTFMSPQINEWRQGLSRIKSKLEIDPAMPKVMIKSCYVTLILQKLNTTSTPQDTGFYECLADNKFSIDRRGFIAKYELN